MDLSDVQEKHNPRRRLLMKVSKKRDFSEYVKGETFDQILHEGRKESADRIMSEALTPLALLLSRELLNILLIPPQSFKDLMITLREGQKV